MLTLSAEKGSITSNGVLTFKAGDSVVILDNVSSGTGDTSSPLNIDTDSDRGGSGTLTIQDGKSVNSNNNVIFITTYDVDLDGSISSGTAAVHIHGSKDGQTIGVGTGGTVTNKNKYDGATVSFESTRSTFHTLAVQADSGMRLRDDLVTGVQALHLDGDADNSTSNDSPDYITIDNGVTVHSKTYLTLEAEAGKILASGAATLKAATGIFIQDTFDGSDDLGSITIHADASVPF
jgi:hypothetical protein